MKTLREYIEILDEISRRDFLKGAGATAGLAAMGAPKDAKAEWLPPITRIDPMTDKSRTLWTNSSADRKFGLHLTNVSGFGYKTPMLVSLYGKWKLPKGPAHLFSQPGKDDEYTRSDMDYPYGRLRIDNMPAVPIRYAFPDDNQSYAYIISDVDNPQSPTGVQLRNMIAAAKNRILIDASQIGQPEIIQFINNPVQEEVDEAASPDAVERIEQLIQYK